MENNCPANIASRLFRPYVPFLMAGVGDSLDSPARGGGVGSGVKLESYASRRYRQVLDISPRPRMSEPWRKGSSSSSLPALEAHRVQAESQKHQRVPFLRHK